MEILQLPDNINTILSTIENAGYEAYGVGGCVRDLLLGNPPHDYDIATSAKPEEVEKIFPRVKATGLKYGTVSVIQHQDSVEVTTFRIDNDYSDGRHPDSVQFSTKIQDDLSRRDFTINAMAYHPAKGLIDPFGGREDIANRLIRAVGDAKTRFGEDALRILRATRFASKLDFTIEEATQTAAKEVAHLVSKVSVERIKIEIQKALVGAKPSKLSQLLSTKAIDFCGFNNQQTNLELLDIVDSTPVIRWAVFFFLQGISTENVKIILRKLKFDNKNAYLIARFCRQLEQPLPQNKIQIKQILSNMDITVLTKLIDAYPLLHTGTDSNNCKQNLAEILQNRECYNLEMLAVKGNDLLALCEEKKIGATLHSMLNEVIAHPENNTKEYLLSNDFLWNIKS